MNVLKGLIRDTASAGNFADRTKEKDVAEEKTLQYTEMGGAFIRCGRTRQTLEPGFYDVVGVGHGNWGLQPKVAVTDELIDIPGTVADEIFDDIDKFMATASRYRAYSLTHKRGYLFYGPPGSGKTSLGMMLAKRFIDRCGGVVMYAGGTAEFYNGVSIMRDVEPGRPSMYLIEEADSIVNNTHCLSILDGELSIQGAVFVAMTNYKEALPPRIANRPGRFDRVTLVNCPPPAVQLEYLRRVEARGNDDAFAPERIVAALDGLPMSMAHLREAFISHVLMGLPLPDLRKRFEIMAGIRTEDGTDDELPDGKPKLAKLKFAHDECDEDDDDDDDYARQRIIDEAKAWEPGDS